MLGSNKGLTPLTATIVLIGFSFLVGTVVMAWGEKYIEDNADFVQGVAKTKLGCEAVKVRAYELGGKFQVCVVNNQFGAIIENGAGVAVEDMQVKLIGSRNVVTQESVLNSPLGQSAVAQIGFEFSDIGVPRQVKFTPKIRVSREVVFCADKSTVVNSFDCSWK